MDRCRRILAKMSEEVYKQRGGKDSPIGGIFSCVDAPALIDRANLDFRDIRKARRIDSPQRMQ